MMVGGNSIAMAMNAADAVLGPVLSSSTPDRAALLCGEQEISYRALDEMACRAGQALRALGCGVGDRVLVLMDDRPEFFFAYLGAMKIGAVPVAVNLRLAAKDLRYIIDDSACRAVIVDGEFLAACREAISGMAAPPLIVLGTTQREGFPGLIELMNEQPAMLASVLLQPDDMALWMYSSGTTGAPKAVVHVQKSIPTLDRYLGPVYGVGAKDRVFCSSKLFFAFALGHVLAALRLGATVVLYTGWPSAEAIAKTIERYRPQVVFSVPTLYRAMLEADLAGTAAFRSVRHYISAGEHLPETLFHRWQAATGRPILEGIGSTEAFIMFLGNRPDDVKAGTVGMPLPATDVKLVAEDGSLIAGADTPGVLYVRSDSLAKGYWHQDEKTAAAFQDGFYCTGDVFIRDEEGYYWYQGRNDDMLKLSGQWVSPVEIEYHVLCNPKVSQAAVVGIEDQAGLVRLALCLVPIDPAQDRATLQEELTALLTARLSIYKCPRRFVFLEDLPKSPTGKTQRFKLRQIAASRLDLSM